MTDPTLFALTILIILATPGPTNTLLATGAAIQGWRRALLLIPAEAAGYLCSILLIGLLIGPLIAQIPLAATILRAAVGAYLVLLAWRLWRYDDQAVGVAGSPISPIQVFGTTLLNPKGLIFALAIIPFHTPHAALYLVGFFLLLVPVSLMWLMAGTLIGRAAARRRWKSVIPRIGAAAVSIFAAVINLGPFLH